MGGVGASAFVVWWPIRFYLVSAPVPMGLIGTLNWVGLGWTGLGLGLGGLGTKGFGTRA